MSIDVEVVRSDTPGTAQVNHLNHAGASLPPAIVTETVVDHLRQESTIGGYEAAAAARDRIDAVYGSIARLIGARDDEIALVDSASRAWALGFAAIPLEAGDRILTSQSEYAANVIALLQAAGRDGVEVEAVPDDEHGQIDVSALDEMVDERTRLIALTHVPTGNGLVNPAEAVGAIARRHGVTYLLDACQSVGQMPVDVGRIGCDLMSVAGRKYLRGPRGTGFLYVKPSFQGVPPVLDLRGAAWDRRDGYTVREDARRFEYWESSIAGSLGLGAAVDYALDLGMDQVWERVATMAGMLRERLRDLPGGEVMDTGVTQGGIVTWRHPAIDPASLRDDLRKAARPINIEVSTVRSTRYDFEDRGIDELVRASVHVTTTESELDEFVHEVAGRLGA